MAQKSRFKNHRDKRETGGFFPMPHAVLRSESFGLLSPYALKLLFDLAAQYRGDNNGDLCVAWTLMKPRNWRSRDTLGKALKELVAGGWIALTRQGGRHQPNLYGLTFFALDDNDKLDIKSSGFPRGAWRQPEPSTKIKSVTRPPCQLAPNQHACRATSTEHDDQLTRLPCQSRPFS